MGRLKAGAAKAVITPPVGCELEGNVREKGAQGIHDDLHARVLVLDNGREEVALVSCALCGLTLALTENVRKYIAALTGLQPEQVLLWATHTHSGPTVIEIHGRQDPEYIAILAKTLAGAVLQAREGKVPARIGWGRGQEESIAFNRRLCLRDGSVRMNWEKLSPAEVEGPLGPIDPEVIALRVENEEGKVLACLFNYALHPAILAGDNFSISEDFPGYTSRLLEQVLGGVALFANGACGNINHINIFEPRQGRGFREAERVGRILGGEALQVLERIYPQEEVELASVKERITLPRRDIAAAEVAWAQRLLAEVGDKRTPLVDGVPDEVYARELLWLAAQGDRPIETVVQVVRIGDLALVGLPGEIFVEFGLALKAQSPFPLTAVIAYANDYIGYVPTVEAFAQGGYEPRTARWSQLAPEAGERLTEAGLRLLQGLAGEKEKQRKGESR